MERKIPPRSKKILVEGLVVSKLRYLITVWSVTTDTNLHRAQVLLNDAAKFITNKTRRTSTTELIIACGWMTITEMADHCKLLLLWKTLKLKFPMYLSDRISLNEDHLATTKGPIILHTTNGWRFRATVLWNRLPPELRTLDSIPRFKKLTKGWIVSQINLDPLP